MRVVFIMKKNPLLKSIVIDCQCILYISGEMVHNPYIV